MVGYPAFVDGEAGAYGVAFPDMPGIVAMGETVGDAVLHAEEALRDHVTEAERVGARVAEPSPIERVSPPEGATLVAIQLRRPGMPKPGSTLPLFWPAVTRLERN